MKINTISKEHINSFRQGEIFAKEEFIEWLNFEFDKFDMITKENKRAEKVRFLFLNELMNKREELKTGREE